MIIAIAIVLAPSAWAGLYVFNPNPADLWDLDHYGYYSWGIDWSPHQDERIDEVVLTFNNIRDYLIEQNDVLYTRLLDNPPLGTNQGFDNQASGDWFEGEGVLIDAWNDPGGYPLPAVTLNYKFSELGLIDDVNRYSADGTFGFGFDPDCHYFNDGIQLTVVTDVPEPGTIALFALGLGMAGARFCRRKRS